MLCGPAITAWTNRPRPGLQVPQQYMLKLADYADTGVPIDYLLYLPPDYDASKRWPLVVFLHGSGERGEDLEQVQRIGLPRPRRAR